MSSKNKYEIAFAPEAWDKWWLYVSMMPGEVGALGYVTLDKEKAIAYVDDLFLVPQTADASEVDFIADGLPFAVERAVADDRLDDLRFCIHSHGEIGTMWSSTDETMIKTMGANADWFVSCVTNRKGSMRGRIDVYRFDPLGDCHIKFDELRMYRAAPPEMEAEARELLDKYVSKPAPKVTQMGFTMGKPSTTYSNKGTPGKPYKIGNQWRWWDGKVMRDLKDEGNDIFSFEDGGIREYLDDEGVSMGFASAEQSEDIAAEYRSVILEEDVVYPSAGEGWILVGEDKVVVDSEGKPIYDKWGCCITDRDLITWDLDELIHADDFREVGSYLIAKQNEAQQVTA